MTNMGMVQVVTDGAKIGIGGVGLFRNKRPYIWIEDGPMVWTLGTLHPRVTPEKFWSLMENGHRNASPKVAAKLAKAMKAPLELFLGIEVTR